jgi:hypothetical protein
MLPVIVTVGAGGGGGGGGGQESPHGSAEAIAGTTTARTQATAHAPYSLRN